MFPELQDNEFFVTGESYGGKYVPAISYTIHENNPTADLKINLKELAVGNGFSDPVNMIDYSEYVYQLGLVDANTRDKMKVFEQGTKDYIANEQWLDAWTGWMDILSTFAAADVDQYNYLLMYEPPESGYYKYYVNQTQVRRAIHVGDNSFDDKAVYNSLLVDFMQSVKPWVEVLANNYRVLYYNGQLDLMIPYVLSENFFLAMNFNAADEYRNAERLIWVLENDIAGYVKSAGNFTEVMVRNAGHMVPANQPVWTLDLISKFVANEPIVPKDAPKVPYF